MPLTLPIDEAIFQDVVTRLEGVPGATVVEYRREPGHWTPQDMQICVVKRNPERAPELDYPGNPCAVAWRMTVNIRMHIMQSETDSTPASTPISEFVASVLETVTTPSNWWQWDAKAVLTDMGTIEFTRPVGSFDSAMLPLVITYRHSENDPFTVR